MIQHSRCPQFITSPINNVFKNKEPFQIVAITTTTVLTTIWLWNFINQDESKYIFNYYVFKQFLI